MSESKNSLVLDYEERPARRLVREWRIGYALWFLTLAWAPLQYWELIPKGMILVPLMYAAWSFYLAYLLHHEQKRTKHLKDVEGARRGTES